MKSFFRKEIIAFCIFNLIFHLQGFAQNTVTLEKGDLKAVFVDNSAYGDYHYKGYNGIAELYHIKQDSTIFVPAFSGVNLEHIFGGDSLVSLFEPRKQPMTIKKLSDSKVLLHQPATAISKAESWTTFEMAEPHYIDVDFHFIIHEPTIFNHGYAGFFWASYINLPEKTGIYLKGKKNKTDSEKWIYIESEGHGTNSTHLSEKDDADYFFAENFNIVLASGISDYIFSAPYYFGRYRNMVFAYLFSEPDEGVIRFSQSPNGAGEGKPAWDFQYILPDFEIGKRYVIKLRVLYKEWVSPEDIEKEYLNWENR